MHRSSPRASAGLSRLAASEAAFGRPRPDHRVQLVNEQDHISAGVGHLAQHRLQAVLEFAPVFRAGDQRPQVQCHHPLILETLRHVALHDPQGQPLDNRRLAHPRLPDQHGIVLGAPRKDLDHTSDLLVAPDDWVELSALGLVDEIDPVTPQRLEFVLRGLIGHSGTSPQVLHRREQIGFADPVELQQVVRLAAALGQRQEQVLGRHELIPHRLGFPLGGLEHVGQFRAQPGCRIAADARIASQFRLQHAVQLAPVGADLLQQGKDDPVRFGQQGEQQVERVDFRMSLLPRELLGVLDRLLRLDGELVQANAHGATPVP